MSKRDYRLIGDALRRSKILLEDANAAPFSVVVGQLMSVFEQDNPRFDRQRFLQYLDTGSDRLDKRGR